MTKFPSSIPLFAAVLCAGPGSAIAQFLPSQAPSANIRRLLMAPKSAPSIQADALVNSASYTNAVTPGSLASMFGTFPVGGTGNAATTPLPVLLDGLMVQLSGVGAPLIYVGGTQANLQVPWEMAGRGVVQLDVTASGQNTEFLGVNMVDYGPGIFTVNGAGTGQGVVTGSDTGELLDASNPATPGKTCLVIYCTGLGPVTNQPATGAMSPSNPLAWTTTLPTVQVGGLPATVLFSGLAPGFVGLYQIDVQTPAGAPTGSAIPVVVSMGGATSNTVTIAVHPAAAGPAVYSLSPASATAGGTALTLTVNGAGYVSGSTVNWNSSALATTYGSATQLTATVPAASIANAGSASVTVANPGAGTSDPVTFSIQSSARNGTIATVAGTGTAGYSGDGGTATGAALKQPYGVAVDSAGNLYIADTNNNVVRKVTGSGSIATVAGNGDSGYAGDGGTATSATLRQPRGVAVDAAGNVYIADTNNNAIRKVSPNGTITTLATGVNLYNPGGIAVDGAGNLFIADTGNSLIRKMATDGTVSTVAGNGGYGPGGDGGPAASAQLESPTAVAVDASGNIYIADTNSGVVRKVTRDGRIATLGGSTMKQPRSVAVDTAGNVYVSTQNNMVRRVTPAGVASTVAGNAFGGYSGDGGNASDAELSAPGGLALDASGNLYIADTGNSVVRRVHAATAIPAPTVTSAVLAAGIDGRLYRVDPAAGASALVGEMPVVMTDIAAYQGVLYGISWGSTLYRLDASTGQGAPIGTGTGAALNALVFSSSGVLYAAGGGSLYTIDTTTGVATLVGSDNYFSSGDLEFDPAGNLYLSSYGGLGGDEILKIDPATGKGTVVANPGYPSIFGLVYLNSHLYGFTDGGQVIIIDLAGGKSTAVASFTPGFNGATSF